MKVKALSGNYIIEVQEEGEYKVGQIYSVGELQFQVIEI